MQLSSPVRTALSLLSLPLALSLTSYPVRASSEPDYVFQASVQEVRIAFTVNDDHGNPVQSLHSGDVVVVDDGWIVRDFRSFRPAAEQPLDLVLLLDMSSSVERDLPQKIAAIKEFLERTNWSERDRISLLVFRGVKPQPICVRNCRAADFEAEIDSLRGDGNTLLQTPLYDAVLQAAELLEQGRDPELRPAMIVLSDGEDTISSGHLGDALRAAEQIEAPIYTVYSSSQKSREGDAVLRQMAAGTGGLSFARKEKLGPALSTVLEDLRSGYVLTYTPQRSKAGAHSVRLLPTRDTTLRFRSRLSYEQE